MAGDEGEMFCPEYWPFDGELSDAPANTPMGKRIPTLRLPDEYQHGGALSRILGHVYQTISPEGFF